MKTPCRFSYFLLMLISAELASALVVHGRAQAVRIPEHTCHRLVYWSSCDWQKCIQECSKEPYGLGQCENNTCICTYYCKEPPK
ncbi:S locus-related glycoprotein 1 binding pollen coat [Quillaja saponaria]|uniref:S locus-related glycoprotein 1 binding pollen coat n=1 Tax=Quillaja saponaria TaxID=32244 RepID=A0AAD7Q7N8_QUISA|nr:S locus-related glycoprotein 1 binding pollen coat [Quillaja saponaria]